MRPPPVSCPRVRQLSLLLLCLGTLCLVPARSSLAMGPGGVDATVVDDTGAPVSGARVQRFDEVATFETPKRTRLSEQVQVTVARP